MEFLCFRMDESHPRYVFGSLKEDVAVAVASSRSCINRRPEVGGSETSFHNIIFYDKRRVGCLSQPCGSLTCHTGEAGSWATSTCKFGLSVINTTDTPRVFIMVSCVTNLSRDWQYRCILACLVHCVAAVTIYKLGSLNVRRSPFILRSLLISYSNDH